MGTGGGNFDAGDLMTAARLQEKTIFKGTGAAIAARTAVTGDLVFCNSSGSGYVSGFYYYYNGSSYTIVLFEDVDRLIYPHSTTIGDYAAAPAIDTTSGTILASSNNPTFMDGFASYADTAAGDLAWPTSDTAAMRVNPTNDNLDFNALTDVSDDHITHDLGSAVSDTLFTIRFSIKWTTRNFNLSTENHLYVGISDNTSGQTTAQDFIGTDFRADNNVSTDYCAIDSDGAALSTSGGDTQQSFQPVVGTTYYFEIARTSSTAYIVRRYSDSTYATVSDSVAGVCAATTATLRYLKICNRVVSAATVVDIGVIDDIRVYSGTATPTTSDIAIDGNTGDRWESASEVNPWIRLELSTSADKEPSEIALWPHANTTATEIKIQTSPDAATWTDKRKITVSSLSMGAWNYIRFNRDIALIRYVRIYGNDGGAKVLAIGEFKLLIPTESNWNRRHGHLSISATDTTLSLSGS